VTQTALRKKELERGLNCSIGGGCGMKGGKKSGKGTQVKDIGKEGGTKRETE